MFCTKCGKQVGENMSFCTNCGAPLKKGTPAPAQAPSGGQAPAKELTMRWHKFLVNFAL